MLHKLALGVLVLAVAFAYTSNASAQDVSKDVKKVAKPAVVTDTKKDVKPAPADKISKDVKKQTKPVTMKSVACGQPGCGFAARGHSAKELRYIIKRHFKRYHKMELADKQLKAMVKKEGSK